MRRKRRIKSMKCPNCLREIDVLATSCSHCGANIDDVLKEEVSKKAFRKDWEKALEVRENLDTYSEIPTVTKFGTELADEIKRRIDLLAENATPKKSKRQIVEEALTLYFEQPEIKKLIKEFA